MNLICKLIGHKRKLEVIADDDGVDWNVSVCQRRGCDHARERRRHWKATVDGPPVGRSARMTTIDCLKKPDWHPPQHVDAGFTLDGLRFIPEPTPLDQVLADTIRRKRREALEDRLIRGEPGPTCDECQRPAVTMARDAYPREEDGFIHRDMGAAKRGCEEHPVDSIEHPMGSVEEE